MLTLPPREVPKPRLGLDQSGRGSSRGGAASTGRLAGLTRRRFIGTASRAAAGLTVFGVAGCNGAAGSRVNHKLKMPLANSFIGNTWRLEMENTYRAALAMEPYRSQVFGQVFNSETTCPTRPISCRT
jgi:hypothetical protein